MATVRVIVTGLIITVVLLAGVQLTGALIDARAPDDSRVERDAAVFGADYDGSLISVNSVAGQNETVYKTTGFALELTGASDSVFSSSESVSLDNDSSWHASVWAEPNSGAVSQTMSVAAVSDGELRIYYNGSANEYAAWYYRQSTRNSYEVAVSDDGSPVAGLTNIQVRANDSELRIYRNGTLGETADITVDSTVAAPTEAGNWDGTIEELRTFSEPLDSSNRSEVVNSPAQQQPDLNRSARVMFDSPYDQDAVILFQGSAGSVANGTLSRVGFSEQIMQRASAENDVAGTTDYVFDRTGPRVAIDDSEGSSELAGAPVAYVDYDTFGTGVSLANLTSTFVGTAALIPFLLIAAAIIARLQ